MILLFSNVVIRTSDVIDLKRDVPVGCKQADEDQLTFEILEKAENQDDFQELLLASPKTYPDLAAKYEETKYNFSHRRNKKFERKQRDFYKNQTEKARQRFAESTKRHFEPTHRERRLHQWGVGALMSPKLPTSDW